MKKPYKLLYLLLIGFLLSCSTKQPPTNKSLVENYIKGLNESNFELIKNQISKDFITKEADFLLTEGKKAFKTHFEWDSVFNPKYQIVEYKSISDSASEIIVTKFCKRIKYLHDSKTKYIATISFRNHLMTSFNITDYLIFDFDKWQSRRDSLSKWNDVHHPELSGFVFDLTKKGGENYLKAIDYYESSLTD